MLDGHDCLPCWLHLIFGIELKPKVALDAVDLQTGGREYGMSKIGGQNYVAGSACGKGILGRQDRPGGPTWHAVAQPPAHSVTVGAVGITARFRACCTGGGRLALQSGRGRCKGCVEGSGCAARWQAGRGRLGRTRAGALKGRLGASPRACVDLEAMNGEVTALNLVHSAWLPAEPGLT
jgi:hypothetical protein